MKTFIFVVLISSLLLLLVRGEDCEEGLKYCGSSLMKLGGYGGKIAEATNIYQRHVTDDYLFNCVGGENNDIAYLTVCSEGCIDNGEGNSDSCA